MNIQLKPTRRDQFRSDEEFAFLSWIHECVEHNLIEDWAYEPKSFHLIDSQTYVEFKQLKTKVKRVERSLHQPTEYTPDFVFRYTNLGYKLLLPHFKKAILASKGDGKVWLDVKGTFSRNDDGRHLSLLQKLTYELHNIWVQKVIPQKLFKATFIPENQRWIKNRKTPTLCKLATSCKTIKEFIGENATTEELGL